VNELLTNERHEYILATLQRQHHVKIAQLTEDLNASESTIRRDLTELEEAGLLVRVHGGATIKKTTIRELSIADKSSKNLQSKKAIAQLAASTIQEGDFIFIDAGTTTFEMIPHLQNKNITVVTNGLTHLESLSLAGVKTYLTGGLVKENTRALVGISALYSLDQYRFDRCFLGVNGMHTTLGFTTPDPEEAAIKKRALELSQQCFILADHSKWDETSFSFIAPLQEATIITDIQDETIVERLTEITTVRTCSV